VHKRKHCGYDYRLLSINKQKVEEIVEWDKKKNIAFGYAILNNDDFAEWGYISIEELIDNEASRDRSWKACTYEDAMK